ncbi:MAG: helix-turn-helix transcriptional regulator [Kiritimatiellales bacterium]
MIRHRLKTDTGGLAEPVFDRPQRYDKRLPHGCVQGYSACIRAGIRMFDIQFRTESPCRLPIEFSKDSVWLGQLRMGSQTVQLPDLGCKTLERDQWLIGRLKELQVVGRPGGYADLLAFAVCPRMMTSLISLADSATAEPLYCFVCANQYKPTLQHGPATARLTWLAESLRMESCDSLQGRLDLEARCLDWINELLHHPALSPARGVCNCSGPDVETLRCVARHLEENLAEEHSLADLCRRFFINEFKLKKGFKALFGTTVFGYLRDKRFQRAEMLLKAGDLSVLEIANEVGYSNPGHFARGFSERFGVTPKDFQSRFLANGAAKQP